MTYMDNVTVYILAGGLGTRLAHIVNNVPKPMADIAGCPFLAWQIMWLRKNGFKKIVLLEKKKKETIMNYFGNGESFGVSIKYSVEEELMGTGGGVIKAINQYPSENFIILNGDTFFDINLKWLYSYSLDNSDKFIIALKYKEDTSRYGYAEINKEYDVIDFIEKNSSLEDGYINGGIYVGKSRLLKGFPEKKCSMEKEIFPILLNSRAIKAIPFGNHFIDIGVPEDYYKAQEDIPKWNKEKKRKALFLDRDGVLVEDTGYVAKIADINFLDKIIEVIKEASKKEYLIIVVTNQAGVAKGKFTLNDMRDANKYIKNYFHNKGAEIDDFYYCPYHEDGIVKEYKKRSLLRKPHPGMILLATEKYNIDIMNSLMVGDKDSDCINLPYLNSYLIQGNYEIKNKQLIKNHSEILTIIVDKGEKNV